MFNRLKRRPFNLGQQGSASWQDRAVAAAEMASPIGGSVVDLGCGNQRLRQLLGDVDYAGYDVEPQTGDVTRVDLRHGMPPGRADLTFALGVVEYLDDPERFFRGLRVFTSRAVVSYVSTDARGPVTDSYRAVRRGKGWLTDLTKQDVRDACTGAGFTIREEREVGRNFLVELI